ncbi:hypothetical protein LCGC14_2175560 [marine sediment metagenome]|uniref:Sulfatase N-terminal domain-containing protein n=1 Tax=marine sediment metagenome TaxID=412755 RepID=A0A0F9GJM4_9ZZZZ
MAEKPHILILMTDQQRGDCLGCAGHPVLNTPNMDRIAAEGVRFERAITNSPICVPARANFISGLYCHSTGVWSNAGSLPADDETFFHHLQQAGYHTGYVGKSHYYPHDSGDHLSNHEDYMHARGIDYVHETTGPWASMRVGSYLTDFWGPDKWRAYADDYRRRSGTAWATWPSPLSEEDFLDSYIGRSAAEFVDGYDGGKPVCLFVGFGGPHEPFDAPGRFATMYDPAACPAPIPAEGLDGLNPAAAAYLGLRERYRPDGRGASAEQIAAARAAGKKLSDRLKAFAQAT